MLKKQLQSGYAVQFQAAGFSLFPRVHNGDCCLFEPTTSASVLRVGDLVFCEVQPGHDFSAQEVIDMYDDRDKRSKKWRCRYILGGPNDTESGWCHIEHIYGRLIEVLQVE